ncbi:acetoin utilization deacetylase AcuC-like enzyme [Paenibacillus forsythiae]|uniref:Acetoin utilization deacetylase AcuC-like enzyme n=1 Tax=Paenibacillus forsythiae TaxID=365616 RepID=A0ABU3H4P9_9BACL|nr:class II histone deacetylase [Paenibacillus forsythiae]MDT3425803.1 acetoin utilization deacetylase AcuC-like enzyme [Paenibacillus forsythiae]
MSLQTGFIYDESYFWHDAGNGVLGWRAGGWLEPDTYAENPATKRRLKNLLDRSGFIQELKSIAPRMATPEELALFHTPAYIGKVKTLSDQQGGDAGMMAIVGIGSYEIAQLSTGGALTAVDAVMKGEAANVYALTRPPGHHAERDNGMGFCLFNNVAVAANYAREQYGLKRILIIDWDVHHGNGTESGFYEDNEILFVSLHQEFNFPYNRGFVSHTGEGKGLGYNVNIPLPAGTGNAGYLYALEKVVGPIAERFQPELILVSAGQDASPFDPLSQMMVTAAGFGEIASYVKGMAERLCQGRLAVCHEGGYSTGYVPFCSLRIIESLSGKKSAVEGDPFQMGIQGLPTDTLFPHQKAAVDEVVKVQSEFWDIG